MNKEVLFCERLKRMGYAHGNVVRMYGQEFELISDPISISDQLIVVDAIERRSGSLRRVCIPLPIVQMIKHERVAA